MSEPAHNGPSSPHGHALPATLAPRVDAAPARGRSGTPELVAIQIHGREIRIRSDEPRAHLEALARYVDERLIQIAGPKKVEPADPNLLLITALQLADEIFKLKHQQQELAARLRSSTRSLLGRLDGAGVGGGAARSEEPARPGRGADASAPKV